MLVLGVAVFLFDKQKEQRLRIKDMFWSVEKSHETELQRNSVRVQCNKTPNPVCHLNEPLLLSKGFLRPHVTHTRRRSVTRTAREQNRIFFFFFRICSPRCVSIFVSLCL
jgi:hypothetical protein